MNLPNFSSNTPWIETGSYQEEMVQTASTNQASTLTLYKTLLSLRRDNEEMRTGGYHQAYLDDDLLMYDVFSDYRKILVVLNFSESARLIKLPGGGQVLLGSYDPDPSGCCMLQGQESLVVAYTSA